jgi:uncharacterized membrane protein
MRKGLFVVGIVLLLIGAAVAGYANFRTAPETLTDTGVLEVTPFLIGSGTLTVSWSGASSSTTVSVYDCSNNACAGASPPPTLASATGASGSIAVSVSSGKTYGIAESGDANGVSANLGISGLSGLVLGGIILVIIGVLLVALSFRAKRARAAPVSMAAAPAVASDVYTSDTPMNTGGTGFESPPTTDPTAAAAAGVTGGRANRVCTSCGTVNEPWLTNCRKCKRPLANTGQG